LRLSSYSSSYFGKRRDGIKSENIKIIIIIIIEKGNCEPNLKLKSDKSQFEEMIKSLIN
jgi:hypothetical protein